MTRDESKIEAGLQRLKLLSDRGFEQKYWLLLTAIAIAAITIAAIFWILAHPYGTNWDEANYINRAYRDIAKFQEGGIGEFLRVLVQEETSRPPAFRIFAFPITLLLGVNPTILRLISWASLGVTLGFVYLAGRCIAGSVAGLFAALFLITCPIIVAPNMRFYVDYPMHLAIAAALYFLFRNWNNGDRAPNSWIGLGIALGLGGLAKPPFAFIAGPIGLLALYLSWRKIVNSPSPRSLIQSGVLGALIMLPWWGFNFRAAISKAFRSGGNVRDALGEQGSLSTIGKWLYVVFQSMLGPALTLLMLAILLTFCLKLFRKQLELNTTQATALLICLAGALPYPTLAAFAVNQNPRLISPALISLAVGMGILAVLTRWTAVKGLAAIATALIGFQIAMMISPSGNTPFYQTGDAASKTLLWGNPTTVMQRTELWDWSKLRELCLEQKIRKPEIGYLGAGYSLSPTQIALPWFQANKSANVERLWQFIPGEEIDWEDLMKAISDRNVVLTVPSFSNNPRFSDIEDSPLKNVDRDNQYNLELVERLKNDPRFEDPIILEMGQIEPTQVFVFIQKADNANP